MNKLLAKVTLKNGKDVNIELTSYLHVTLSSLYECNVKDGYLYGENSMIKVEDISAIETISREYKSRKE